ncbi:hypothetical protein [Streptomyces sp. P9-A4]|uniref:hypothetical protein n=1 Tax=Streptomyces sp. P9-A4 TaxID=3072285 RepID=UPI002FCB989E
MVGGLVVDLAAVAAVHAPQVLVEFAAVSAVQVEGGVYGHPGEPGARLTVLLLVLATGAGDEGVEADVACPVAVLAQREDKRVGGSGPQHGDAVAVGEDGAVLPGGQAGDVGAEEAAQQELFAQAVAAVPAELRALLRGSAGEEQGEEQGEAVEAGGEHDVVEALLVVQEGVGVGGGAVLGVDGVLGHAALGGPFGVALTDRERGGHEDGTGCGSGLRPVKDTM